MRRWHASTGPRKETAHPGRPAGVRGLHLALAVASVWLLLPSCKRAGGQETDKTHEVVPVEVTTARYMDVVRNVYLSGEVLADVEVKVLSLVAERVLKITFEEGQQVKKGDLLALIKAGPLYDTVRMAKAGLRAAKTQLELAKLELERTKKLHAQGAVPLATLQRAQAQFEAAQAQVAQMKASLSQSYQTISRIRITAPISGVIGRKFLNEGDIAGPQIPLCTIVQMDRVRIQAQATELDVVKLRKGQKATITVPAYPHESWTGQVTFISPILDRTTRTATVTILVDNKDHKLRPGMFADVVVETGRRHGVVMIPALAVVRNVAADESVRHMVYVVKGDTVKARTVELGVRQGKYVEVRKGLRPGEEIAVVGVFRLRDGMRIKIVGRVGEPGPEAKKVALPPTRGAGRQPTGAKTPARRPR